MSRNLYLVCCGIFVYFLGISSVFSQINHQLEVNLNPESHTIQVIDTLTLPESISYSIQFTLHAGLKPKVLDDNIELKLLQIPKSSQSNNQTQLPLEHYQLSFKNKQKLIRIQYGGEIFHDVKNISKDYARSFKETSGIINNEGVFLAGASYWYPVFENELVTFSLNINLPKDWKSVSQGSYKKIVTAKDKSSDTWTIDKPQQEIYLIAAKFYLYQQKSDSIVAQVFLRTEDPALAQKYLDVTSRYITMYNKLLGLYPYNKFALVENFWETGYGMPSFTLLGPKVIRLPFILHSSYPHEILHNWWGN
ncbi:MAG: peptidase M28, partial [Thiohalomonadales bacterium]